MSADVLKKCACGHLPAWDREEDFVDHLKENDCPLVGLHPAKEWNGFYLPRMRLSPDYHKMREMVTLLVECRDALPAISLASAKLRGIDLTLDKKIEACLEPWEIKE